MPRLPVRDAVSAGGVVWRRDARGRVEIALCGRTADGTWMLPKGTPDPGESHEETALREVREETGLVARLGEPLRTIQYWFTFDGVRYHKRVYHWLMEAVGGNTADHDHEFDEVRWVPIAEAHQMVQFSNQREVVADAARLRGVEL
jgi:8-oxo-dGTP pyrophosphatase MutT (NUDIX family)